KELLGMANNAIGGVVSVWIGSKKAADFNLSEQLAYTVSGSLKIASSGYNLAKRRGNNQSTSQKLTADLMWHKIESIIKEDKYGLKGLDKAIADQATQNQRNHQENPQADLLENYADLDNRTKNAVDQYMDLSGSLGRMYIKVDNLINARDLKEFKTRLVAAAIE
ncbi:MAG: hypothetical protein LIO96_02530, partial [Lachnospiraceae bacterium]|nr:hypothetical protein [Lachnospiraceae bacterium]